MKLDSKDIGLFFLKNITKLLKFKKLNVVLAIFVTH